MKLNLYITNAASYLSGGRTFHATSATVDIEGWYLAGTVEFEPDVDNEDLTKSAVTKLNDEENEQRATFIRRLDAIEESRQKLLSIPHLSSHAE